MSRQAEMMAAATAIVLAGGGGGAAATELEGTAMGRFVKLGGVIMK